MSVSEVAPAPTWRDRLGRVPWQQLTPLLGLVLLVVVGSLIHPSFLTPTNIFNVLTRSAFIGIIAVGATFVIIAGGIDLSVGSMAAFLAGAMILFMNAVHGGGVSPVSVVLLGVGLVLVGGLAAGAANGIAITRGRIEAFIVTLGTLGIFRSLVTYLADGGTISLDFALRGVYRPVFYGYFLGIPIPVWAFAVVALVGAIVLHRTRFGRYVRAIGSNAEVARYAAIKVERVRTLTYVIQGVCVAIAVVLYVPRLGSASGSTGILWELEAIAAVIIGGTALKGGSGHVWGTVVGAVRLSLIGNVLNLTTAISEYLNGAVQGLIIIAAVVLPRGRRGRCGAAARRTARTRPEPRRVRDPRPEAAADLRHPSQEVTCSVRSVPQPSSPRSRPAQPSPRPPSSGSRSRRPPTAGPAASTGGRTRPSSASRPPTRTCRS